MSSSDCKHAAEIEYGAKFQLSVLVETGTYFGDNVAFAKDYFSDIYSIELSPELHEHAKKRFANDPKVHLFLGDSGKVLRELLPKLARKPLFWLDAHYSAGVTARGELETPIMQELDAIFTLCPDSVILIDDAWCFGANDAYPTLPDLKTYVEKRAPHWVFKVKDDIIRLHEAEVRT